MKKMVKRFAWLSIPLLILVTVYLNPKLNQTPALLADDSSQLFLPIVEQGAETTSFPTKEEPKVEFSATPTTLAETPEPLSATDTSTPKPLPATHTVTSTPRPLSPTYTATPAPDPTLVWPALSGSGTVQARAGQEFQITGEGGYLIEHDGDYNETAQYFELYFNDELVDELLCYVNHCQSNFTVPTDAQPGMYELSTEGGSSLTVEIVEGEPADSTPMAYYLSSSTGGTVDDVQFADEDILIYDLNDEAWSLYFDGSDVGLHRRDVNAFHVMADGNLLLSLDEPRTIDGIHYQASDILKFSATSLGKDTEGAFSMYLDGSEVELTEEEENIDAIALLDNGDLLISTLGTAQVSDVTAEAEDLLRLHRSELDDNVLDDNVLDDNVLDDNELGNEESVTWSLYLDGSALNLSNKNENIWAVWATDGQVELSTYRKYTINSMGTELEGDGDDLIRCHDLTAEGECALSRIWDGDDHGFGSELIDGYSMGPLFTRSIYHNTADYLTGVRFEPEEAKYFDLIDGAMDLSEPEVEMLTQNGLVVSERQQWGRFVDAYAWIYWKDLPVLITTDSILHMVHQSYSDMLKALEQAILIPEMAQFLAALQEQLEIERQNNSDAELSVHYDEVEIYLDVAYALLTGNINVGGDAQQYVDAGIAADSHIEIALLGEKRPIDFTLFQPRGHYLGNGEALERYFRAMSWLAHLDFRWSQADPITSELKLNPDAIAATLILHQTIENAFERSHWESINDLLEGLVGRSDNMTLFDLDRFISDTGLTPKSALTADEEQLLEQLSSNDYGQQRITGQLVLRHLDNDSADPIPRPTSFMLLGQRFAIDPYVMSNLVFDRLKNGEELIKRPLPSPLDVMYALGNDRAVNHLTDEMAHYQYEDALSQQRMLVDALPNTFWDAPIYNQWLQLIRTLNPPTTAKNYPLSMRTTAWSDKILHTQLSSWAQLRHDHLLYVKQSYTTDTIACEYPAGYVEPYPEFYAALYDFAQAGYATLEEVPGEILHGEGLNTQAKTLEYFENVMSISLQLQTLAEKELRLEEFTSAEELFLKSIVVRKTNLEFNYNTPFLWDGWYFDLFFHEDDNPALIADVHTNSTSDPASPLYPPRVLHVATGPVVPIYMIVDTDEGSTLYVGPSFTYFEVIEQGDSETLPARLNDKDWRIRLQQPDYPVSNVPEWTQSFRVTTSEPPSLMYIPE